MVAMGQCPLWGTQCTISDNGRSLWVDSARTAGLYHITRNVERNIRHREQFSELDNKKKALITTWLIDQRKQGTEQPDITTGIVQRAVSGELRPLTLREKADRVLIELIRRTEFFGESVSIPNLVNEESVLAYTETTEPEEIGEFIQYLKKIGYVDMQPQSTNICAVTVEGHERVADLENTNLASKQIFVAMWFDESINCLYDEAIKSAIEQAGYVPCRVDRPLREDKSAFEMKVCDRIEVEVRRSRMLVADFTHGDSGARGGVYFEAGLARGLGIPVIWTCSEEMFGKLHFDTRQYPHIGWQWSKLEKFKQELSDRIQVLAQIT